MKITYHDLPSILTIEEAIAAKSFFVENRTLSRVCIIVTLKLICFLQLFYFRSTFSLTVQGDLEKGFAESDTIVTGELRMGGQEHFYMETQTCLCIPSGEGELEVISSTQAVSKTQTLVASVLNMPANRVVCRVKRMGGGFGGKETRSASETHLYSRSKHCLYWIVGIINRLVDKLKQV